MPGSWTPDDFPKLHSLNHRVTSPCKNRYNCIAWAAGSDDRWWWPTRYGFWPPGVPREETLAAFAAAFATLGYAECRDGSPERGYEKVALFARRDAEGRLAPTHAAKQLADGRWTSKLGRLEDIEHGEAEDVNGPLYGAPVRFMRRAVSP